MLVEMAIGDAYGIAWEFVEGADIEAVGPNDLSGYRQHPKYPAMGNGRYTDDTQRSLGNAELLLRGEGLLNDHQFAYAYVEGFKRDPRQGYTKRMYELLSSVENVRDFCERIDPSGINNGSIMGAAVLGYLPSIWQVRNAAYNQAMTTHGVGTFRWAFAIALMAHFFLYRIGPRDELTDFLEHHIPLEIDDEVWFRWSMWGGGYRLEVPTTMDAETTVAAVLGLIINEDSLSGILKSAVSIGGDTDTVAAIAMAIGSCAQDITNDIPKTLYEGLENGPYGRDYLADLDRKLHERFIWGLFPETAVV